MKCTIRRLARSSFNQWLSRNSIHGRIGPLNGKVRKQRRFGACQEPFCGVRSEMMDRDAFLGVKVRRCSFGDAMHIDYN